MRAPLGRPFRARRSFLPVTQGVALGYLGSPRWGWMNFRARSAIHERGLEPHGKTTQRFEAKPPHKGHRRGRLGSEALAAMADYRVVVMTEDDSVDRCRQR